MGNELKGIPKENLEDRNGELFLEGELSDEESKNKLEKKNYEKENKVNDSSELESSENDVESGNKKGGNKNIKESKKGDEIKDEQKKREDINVNNKKEKEDDKIINKEKENKNNIKKKNYNLEKENKINNKGANNNKEEENNKSINEKNNNKNNKEDIKRENVNSKKKSVNEFPNIKLKNIKNSKNEKKIDKEKENNKQDDKQNSNNNDNYNNIYKSNKNIKCIKNNTNNSSFYKIKENNKNDNNKEKYNNPDYYEENKKHKLILPLLNEQDKNRNIHRYKNNKNIYENEYNNKSYYITQSEKNNNPNIRYNNENKLLNSKLRYLNASSDNIRFNNTKNNYKFPKIKLKSYINENNLDVYKYEKEENISPIMLISTNQVKKYYCKYTIKAHFSEITYMTFLKTKNEFATGSLDNKIKLWKISRINYEILLMSILEGHKDGILTIKYMANVNKLLSTSKDKTLKIWDLLYLNCLQTIKCNESIILACSYNPLIIPYEIISGGDDNNIVIWDKIFNTNNRKVEYSIKDILRGHIESVLSLLFIEEYKYLFSGSKDMTIRIWNYESNYSCISIIDELNTGIYCIKYNYINYNINKNVLIVSCEDGNVYFIDIKRRKKIKSILFSQYPVKNFDVNENQLLIGSNDHKGRIWNFETKLKETLKGHKKAVSSILKLDEQTVITSSFDSTIKLWNKEYIFYRKYKNL